MSSTFGGFVGSLRAGEYGQVLGKKKRQVKIHPMDRDWSDALIHLFNLKPFYRLDFEEIRGGPLFASDGYPQEEEYSDEEYDFDDGEFAIWGDKVLAGKSAKKGSSGPTNRDFRSAMKYTRKARRGRSPVRARMIEQKILRGGLYQCRPIAFGSYGPCGFEI